nr:MFS transporter [Rhodoferax sp.]
MPQEIDSGGRAGQAGAGQATPRRGLAVLWAGWLPADDLLRQPAYLRIWVSVLISSLGGQVTMLALPLTAALLLAATPTQMGWLTAMETLPFVLFSLPAGVWLDRVAKLPVYLAGEVLLCVAVLSVPLAWWMGGTAWLGMGWLYAVAFVIGTVSTVAGSAAQIVLTQVVGRDRLVEAFARNALASSGAEVAGPGLAGLLIKAVGAPLALLVDAVMLLGSALVLRGVPVMERLPANQSAQVRSSARATAEARAAGEQPVSGRSLRWQQLRRELQGFGAELAVGLRFVLRHQLLVQLAMLAGLWQFCYHSAMVVQILYATRSLGLSEQGVGLSYVAVGVGSVLGSLSGSAVSRRLGPGPALLLGQALTGAGWLLAV